MHNVTGKYRVAPITTRAVAIAAALITFGALVGCSGFAEQARAERESGSDGHEVAVGLYQSMLVVFREDTAGIEFTSEDRLVVISDYEPVEEERRRRFFGQVVPVGSGIGVRITAEYQYASGADDEEKQWVDEPRESVEGEASPDELRMARRVERIYHRGDY